MPSPKGIGSTSVSPICNKGVLQDVPSPKGDERVDKKDLKAPEQPGVPEKLPEMDEEVWTC